MVMKAAEFRPVAISGAEEPLVPCTMLHWTSVERHSQFRFLRDQLGRVRGDRVDAKFLRGQRYSSLEAGSHSFSLYEMTRGVPPTSLSYQQSSFASLGSCNSSLPASESFLTIGSRVYQTPTGANPVIETIRLESSLPPGQFPARIERYVLQYLNGRLGVAGVTLLKEHSTSTVYGAKPWSKVPQSFWTLIVGFNDTAAISEVQSNMLNRSVLIGCGASSIESRGTFRLFDLLSEVELAQELAAA